MQRTYSVEMYDKDMNPLDCTFNLKEDSLREMLIQRFHRSDVGEIIGWLYESGVCSLYIDDKSIVVKAYNIW